MRKQKKNDNNSNTANIREQLKSAVTFIQSDKDDIDGKTILQKRAKELSTALSKETRGEYFEYIEFMLADELYGIEKEFIKEVFPLKDLTPLPCVPDFIIGIINVRGKILSVIDLKKFFDLPDSGKNELNSVIILQNNELEFCILADKVLGVGKAYLNEVQKSLPTLKGIREDFLRGITPGRIILLDHNKILNDNQLVINEQV